jgi:hypothetical protein
VYEAEAMCAQDRGDDEERQRCVDAARVWDPRYRLRIPDLPEPGHVTRDGQPTDSGIVAAQVAWLFPDNTAEQTQSLAENVWRTQLDIGDIRPRTDLPRPVQAAASGRPAVALAHVCRGARPRERRFRTRGQRRANRGSPSGEDPPAGDREPALAGGRGDGR